MPLHVAAKAARLSDALTEYWIESWVIQQNSHFGRGIRVQFGSKVRNDRSTVIGEDCSSWQNGLITAIRRTLFECRLLVSVPLRNVQHVIGFKFETRPPQRSLPIGAIR